jgi:16S rRNA processing protein RimM
MSAPDEDLISIARIARPQGRRGEVIADLLTDFPDRFADLEVARVKRSSGEISLLKLEGFRPHKGRVLLKFAGYDSIDRAEELRGAQVMVTRNQLVRLPEDTWYDFDLIGCHVLTTEGAPVGRVVSVLDYGAAPLLAVKDQENRELLIPLTLSICIEIDVANKRIVVNPPEGLLDL